jgi:hypothetical protein
LDTIRLFVGHDPRESVGLHVFCESVWNQTSLPVEIVALTPKVNEVLGLGSSQSTNAFGKLRFAVPHICDYKGFAIFMDGADCLLRADLAELWAMREAWYAVKVVKHEYETKAARKYVGTDMESDNGSYERKNWSSVMLFDCGHYMNRQLTPNFIRDHPSAYLHRFKWLPDERIGDLPANWNVLIGEQQSGLETKLAHFTLGGPFFQHYKDCDHAGEWRAHYVSATKGLQTEVSER